MKRIQVVAYSKQDLKAIRKVLPYRYMGRLAARLGLSRVHITQVLAGARTSAPVADAALQMALENAEATFRLVHKIRNRRNGE